MHNLSFALPIRDAVRCVRRCPHALRLVTGVAIQAGGAAVLLADASRLLLG
jgi:hypothetical protein